MHPEERRHRIEEFLQKVEFASLEDLVGFAGASAATVRRDLIELESTGSIRRTHGGARSMNSRTEEFVFSARDSHQVEEKEAIGRACAELVEPNQSVIIDTGTTCYHAARHLGDKRLQIVTNSLPVANCFASTGMVEVVVSGGVVYPRLGALVGPAAVESLSRIHADLAIMSGSGVTMEGIFNSHALLIDIQRAIIEAAHRVVFCLDHTKWGRKSVAHICALEVIDTIVTDGAAPADMVEALRRQGIEVIVAGGERPARPVA